jgi:hypothetical protein
MGAIAAAVLPALISVGGQLIGGSSSQSASNDQVNAANEAIQAMQQQFAQTRSDLLPWLTAGSSALGPMQALLGIGGADAQQSAINNLENGPMFQSMMRNGQEAILGNASATGGLRGGNTQGALFNLGQDALAQVIQQQFNNLGMLSGQGLGAGSSLGQFGAENAANIADLLGQRGAAQAGGALANGQMWGGIANGIGGLFGSGGPLSGIFGGGGSSGGGIPFNPSDMSTWDPIAQSVGF